MELEQMQKEIRALLENCSFLINSIAKLELRLTELRRTTYCSDVEDSE